MAGRPRTRQRRFPATRVGTGDGPTPGSAADDTPDADPEAVARELVLRQLTASPKSRAQLEDALVRRGVSDEVAARVLDRFTEVGLVDDAAFAEAWVRTRHTGRGLARRALAAELRDRGVEREVAAEAVDTLDADDEREAARALVERRLPSTRSLDPRKRASRLVGMLARKGYPAGLAYAVVREALAADSAGAAGHGGGATAGAGVGDDALDGAEGDALDGLGDPSP